MAAGKARVHELAKELGVTSKEVLARLSEQGEFVKSASSTVEAPVARRLRESFGGSKPAPAKGTAKSPGKGPDKSLDKALDAAIDMAAGNGKATAAPAKAPIPAGRQSSPQLPPPHPSLRPQCRPALRHPTPAWLPGRGRARCRSRGFAPRASATTRSRRRNPPTGPSRVRRLPAPVPSPPNVDKTTPPASAPRCSPRPPRPPTPTAHHRITTTTHRRFRLTC